ncbi:hypothetical protein DFS33DRAFT_1306821, partial [Desarmillaria ectypa]
ILHSTATLSPEGVCGLYRLRLMHRLNIFLSHFGHSGWVGLLFFAVYERGLPFGCLSSCSKQIEVKYLSLK